jgi:hypothetical protein
MTVSGRAYQPSRYRDSPYSLFAHTSPRWRVVAFAGCLLACSSDERFKLTKPGAGGGRRQYGTSRRIPPSALWNLSRTRWIAH